MAAVILNRPPIEVAYEVTKEPSGSRFDFCFECLSCHWQHRFNIPLLRGDIELSKDDYVNEVIQAHSMRHRPRVF